MDGSSTRHSFCHFVTYGCYLPPVWGALAVQVLRAEARKSLLQASHSPGAHQVVVAKWLSFQLQLPASSNMGLIILACLTRLLQEYMKCFEHLKCAIRMQSVIKYVVFITLEVRRGGRNASKSSMVIPRPELGIISCTLLIWKYWINFPHIFVFVCVLKKPTTPKMSLLELCMCNITLHIRSQISQVKGSQLTGLEGTSTFDSVGLAVSAGLDDLNLIAIWGLSWILKQYWFITFFLRWT